MQCSPFLTGAAHFDHLVECCPLSSLDNYLSLSPLQLISSLRGWQDHWNTWLQIRISPTVQCGLMIFGWYNIYLDEQTANDFPTPSLSPYLPVSPWNPPFSSAYLFIYILLVWTHAFPFFSIIYLWITIFIWVLKQSQVSLVGGPSRWLLYPCDRSPVLWTLPYFQAYLVPTLPYPWY